MNENLKPRKMKELSKQEPVDKLEKTLRTPEDLKHSGRAGDGVRPLLAELSTGPEGKGVSLDGRLNAGSSVSFSGLSPAQCSRLSAGTQNYCPFAGSGR